MPLKNKTIDSLSHQRKNTILCNDADAHRKQCEFLPLEKKIKIFEADADAHKNRGSGSDFVKFSNGLNTNSEYSNLLN
jgi:hypothetical protein